MKLQFNHKADVLEQSVIDAIDKLAEWLLSDVVNKQVIPFDVGTLQNASTFVNREHIKEGKVSLVSSTPYARRLYYHPEYNFQTKNNPNAKGHWYEDWMDGGKYANKVKRNFEIILKELGDV